MSEIKSSLNETEIARRKAAIQSSRSYIEAAEKAPGVSAQALRNFGIRYKAYLIPLETPAEAKQYRRSRNLEELERLRLQRHKNGMTDEEMARAEGIQQKAIQQWRTRRNLKVNRARVVRQSQPRTRREATPEMVRFFQEVFARHQEKRIRKKRLACRNPYFQAAIKGGRDNEMRHMHS